VVGDDGRGTKDFDHSDWGVPGRHAADFDGVAVRGEFDVLDGGVPAVREPTIVAFGIDVVVVVLLHVLGGEHAGDGPAWWRGHTVRVWAGRVERGGIERGGRRRASLHVRNVVLERERGCVGRMGAWMGAEEEDPSRPPRVEHGTVGVRLLGDGRRSEVENNTMDIVYGSSAVRCQRNYWKIV